MSATRTAISIFLLVLAAVAVIAPQDPSNAQQVARLALTLSIVEEQGFAIDRYADRTVDKAVVGEHYFAAQLPGLSLLAVPVVAIAYVVGISPGINEGFALLLYLATVGVNGTLMALGAALLYLMARRWGLGGGAALFAAFATAMATPLFGWSSAFFAHAVAGVVLVLALAVVTLTKNRGAMPALIGAVLGFGIVLDLTIAPAIAFEGAGIAWFLLRNRGWAAVITMATGAIAAVSPLLIYNWLAFGGAFTLGYARLVGWEAVRSGFFGIAVPRLDVAVELLFGVYRGLLPLSPILLLVPMGLWRMWRQGQRQVAVLCLFTMLSLLLINSGYHYWQGGWSTGPRYLVACLPIVGITMAYAWPRTMVGKGIAVMLLVVSANLSLACALGGMFAPNDYANPLFDYVLPRIGPPELAKGAFVLGIWAAFAVLAVNRRSAPEPKTD